MQEINKKLYIPKIAISMLSDTELEQMAYDFSIVTFWLDVLRNSKLDLKTSNKGAQNGNNSNK